MPFQIAENSDDYDYGKIYQILLQISCYSEGVLSQDLLAMQHKQQGLIREYLHFLVDNARLVKRVGNSHVVFMYCLVENNLHLFTFKDFFHAPYCQAVKAQDDNNVDNSEEAEESGGDKATAGAGNGSEFNKASNESDVTVEMENKPMLKAKGKCKASELVGAAKGHKDGTKCMKVTRQACCRGGGEGEACCKDCGGENPCKGQDPFQVPLKKEIILCLISTLNIQ